MRIVSYSIDDYMRLVKSFHGNIAPGLIIGGYMVDLAIKNLDEGILFNAISETGSCLPDAIQLLTPCTIGNGWLTIMDFGRFALCLYEKYHGDGIRVSLDYKKLEDWPEIKTWFFRLKPKTEQDPVMLRDQIIEAGSDILSIRKVTIEKDLLPIGKNRGIITMCPDCGEAYPVNDGPVCLACKGFNPYINFKKSITSKTRPVLGIVKTR